MITRLAIAGYRSLRDVRLELGPLTVITGANGSGKSSLYRALHLLADVAQGGVVQSLAQEGGLPSVLWAGPESFSRAMKSGEQEVQGTRRKDSVSLKLGFSGDDYGYAIDLGFPPQKPPSAFNLDPMIKLEALWSGEKLGRANLFAERRGPGVRVRDESGEWRQAYTQLSPFDSMMTHCSDPHSGRDLLILRETMRLWRFYDHLRTDRDAPARRPQIGTYTPVLSGDGSDLAAAIQTIIEIGDKEALDGAVADAFPGGSVGVVPGGFFELHMHQHGLLRPLSTAELSDGTLRYLLLVAALLTPRPPPLMILNEPETSLHRDLLAPLVRLIAHASKSTQIIVVSHAAGLVLPLAEQADCTQIVLEKELGETVVKEAERPAWAWPTR